MTTSPQIPDWLSKVLIGAASGFAVQFALFIVRNALRLAEGIVYRVKQRQGMRQNDFFSVYADMEELLGDFLEKYKNITKLTPVISKWEFFRMLLSDIAGIAIGLTKIALVKFLGSDELPRA